MNSEADVGMALWTELEGCSNLTKESFRVIANISTSHCRLNYHMEKLGSSAGTISRFWEENDETSIYTLVQCPAHNTR